MLCGTTPIMSFMINIELKLLKFNPITNKLIGQYFDLRLLCIIKGGQVCDIFHMYHIPSLHIIFALAHVNLNKPKFWYTTSHDPVRLHQEVTDKIVAIKPRVAPVISRLRQTAPLTSSATGYSTHNCSYKTSETYKGNFFLRLCILLSLAHKANLPIKAYKQTILAHVITPCKNSSLATPMNVS
ncbi:hypothetical protein ALC53_12627 [Atta colombica]|uniref:Uncharacterized protein n=1 Tax=Atta colombica TaxID=520822 RepID=A0A151HYZ7_9HYME|nr:hypothetical protein ALC53_12627 [Atta colombica]